MVFGISMHAGRTFLQSNIYVSFRHEEANQKKISHLIVVADGTGDARTSLEETLII